MHLTAVLIQKAFLKIWNQNKFSKCSMWSLSIYFRTKILYTFTRLPVIFYMPFRGRFFHPSNTCLEVQIMKLLIYNFLQSPINSVFLEPNTSPCTLLSNTLSQCFSSSTTHDVSRPYKEQYKLHFTALHVIQLAFCEQQYQQSCTVHRHGEQVHF